MIRNTFYFGTALVFLIFFSENIFAIDFNSLADQSSYRCSGGVVAIGDSDRDVQDKCGDPLEIGARQDSGPVWIYHHQQANFMYYLVFANGKLQRIVGSSCSVDDPACFDLR